MPFNFHQLEFYFTHKIWLINEEKFSPFKRYAFNAMRKLVLTVECFINRHLNNAVYGDLISNLLENRLFQGDTIRELSLFYHREAKPGDQLLLSTAQEGDVVHIRGEVDGSRCFEASVTLEKSEGEAV